MEYFFLEIWRFKKHIALSEKTPPLVVLKPDYFAEKLTLCIINKFNFNLNWIGRVRSHLISQYIINKEYTLTKKPAYLSMSFFVASTRIKLFTFHKNCKLLKTDTVISNQMLLTQNLIYWQWLVSFQKSSVFRNRYNLKSFHATF